MIPKILEYEDGLLKVTAEAYCIPELKEILDKHGDKADPYLAYVHLRTYPTSAYKNMLDSEAHEQATFDVINTVGDFDPEDELLEPAIVRLNSMFHSALGLTVLQMEQELHKLRIFLKFSDWTEDNMRERTAVMQNIDKISTAYGKVKEQADKELEIKMRGKSQSGEY